MPGKRSHTRTVNNASGSVDFPTEMDTFSITNIGANRVWYCSDNSASTAVVEGDDMEVISPGSTVVVGGRKSMPMIAETGATKIVISGAQGRI